MLIATLKGRLQTKLVTYLVLAVVTAVFAMMGSPTYWLLFLIAMPIGIFLEAVWGLTVDYQPGWMTFLMAAIEFGVIAIVAYMMSMPMEMKNALVYYLVSWAIIQLFLIYFMPILRLNWNDKGLEVND